MVNDSSPITPINMLINKLFFILLCISQYTTYNLHLFQII